MHRFRKQAAAVGLTVLLLCGLRAGAQAAGDAAQKFLTPEQIAQIDQMQAAKNQSRDSQATIAVHGTVTTADSSPLPRNLWVSIQSRSTEYTAGYSAAVGPSGQFTSQVHSGELFLAAESKGFAPVFAGPIGQGPDGNYLPVQLVLSPGFSARVQLADPDGKPIPNVELSAVYTDGISLGQQTIRTDTQGAGTLIHSTSQHPVQIDVSQPGYEYQRVKLTLNPDRPNTVTLIPEAPTTGTVVDAQTGEPLPNATIKQLARTGFEQAVSWDNMPPPLLATTDAQGRFTLHSLRRDSQYALWVSAAGHGSEFISDLRPGRTDLVWKLGPERVIRGRITGDLSKIETRDPKTRQLIHQIYYTNPLTLENTSYSWQQKLEVIVVADIGAFELRDPLPGRVEFLAADKRAAVNTSAIPPMVEMHIDTPAEIAAAPAPSERLVTLKLQIPEGAPAPRGKLLFYYLDAPQHTYKYAEVAVKDSTASLEITAPGKIGYAPGNVIGYWFADKLDVNVPAGDGPFTWSVPVVPAGVIHGRVTEPDGSPSSNFSVSVIEIAKSPALGDQYDSRQPFDARDHTGEFLITPLPLGGRYRLVATTENRIAMSDALTLDGSAADQQVNLKFAEGAPLRVKITGPDGHPRAGVSVTLDFGAKPANSYSGPAKSTGADGVALFDHVNPDADGSYTLRIAPGGDYPGLSSLVKPGGEVINLTLPKAVSLKGRVLDDRNGKPLARAKIHAWPVNPTVGSDTTSLTDADGRFDFENVEDRQYALQVEETDPPGTLLHKNPDGTTSYTYPPGFTYPQAHGGQSEEIILRVVPRN